MSTLKTNNIQHVDRSDPSIIINTDGSVNIAGTMTYEDVTNVDAVGIITGRSLINAQKQIHVGTGVSVKAGGLNVTAGITTVQALQATTGNFSSNLDVAGELTVAETIAHTGDTNNKISFPSADTITLTTAGSERLRIMSSGAIGIRTTTGSNTVNIGGAAGLGVKFHNFTTGNSSFITLESGDKLQSNVGGSGYYTWVTGGTEKLRIASDGDVIIGGSSDAGYANYADNLTIHGTGNEGITIRSGATSQGAIYFSDATGTGTGTYEGSVIYDHNDNHLRMATNHVERFRITSAGLVGIGTAPETNANLHIMGASRGRVIVHAGGSESAQLWLRNPKRTWKIHNYYDQDSLIFTDDSDTRLTINAQGDATFAGIATATQFAATTINNSRKNLLINGAMTVNQRVGSPSLSYFNPVTSAIYTLDRWKVMNGSSFDTDSAHISKSTQSPDGFSSSMKWDIGNTETPSANQNCGIEQKIEGYNLQHLAYGTSSAKTMTLSFYVRSNKLGTYCVHIMQEDGTKYQMHEYTISSSNTWEKKTIKIVGNTANAINDDNTTGLRIIWVLTVGSSDHVAATSTWASGGDLAGTSNQVNLWDNGSNDWYLTGCQLELGDVATAYEARNFGEELALCERYYEAVYMTDGTAAMPSYASYGGTTNFEYQFKVEKRATPTWSLEGNASWSGATPNAFESRSACVFQHNSGTLFRLSDGADDLCGSFSAEL